MHKRGIDKIFILLIVVWQCFELSTSVNFEGINVFNHTDPYAFFSEKYCGIAIDFAYSSNLTGNFRVIIEVEESMIPYQLSIEYWDSYEYCPNFEKIKPPTSVNHKIIRFQLNLLKLSNHFSIIFFSRFANVSDFHATLSFQDLNNNIDQKITIDHQLSNNILLDTYDLVIPQTLEEGKLYYSNFTAAFLNRSIAFHKNPVGCSVHVDTIPKSGTHLIARMIEEITGEWVVVFPNYEFQFSEIKDQIQYSYPPYVKVLVDHGPEIKSFRKVKVVRDILDGINSWCHNKITRSHIKRLENDYYLESNYLECMKELLEDAKSKKKRNPTNAMLQQNIHFRYEDFMLNPIETFKELITCVLGYPVQHTIYNKKIEEVIRTKGLISAYKNVSQSETQNNVKSNLINLIPSSLIEYIFITFPVYNYYFGYFDKYHQYMKDHNISYDAKSIDKKIQHLRADYKTNKENIFNKIIYENGYHDYTLK